MKEVFDECYYCHAPLKLEISQTSVHTFEGHRNEFTIKHEPSLACTKCNNIFQAEPYQFEKTSAFLHFLMSIKLKNGDKFSDKDKDYIHFYCAVRSILFKLTKGDVPDIAQMNARVRELLEGAIQSDGIEELFESGKQIEVDLFGDEYMNRINAIQLPDQGDKRAV